MGSAQSYVTPETAFAAALATGVIGIGIGYTQISRGSNGVPADKKGKKKKTTALPLDPLPPSTENKLRPAPVVIPGAFDTPTVSTPAPETVDVTFPKPKKSKKKKKGKSSAAGGATALEPISTAGYHSDSSAEHPQPKAKRSQKPSPSSSQLTRTPALQSTISIDTDDSWTRVGSARRKQRVSGAADTSEGPSGPSADPTTSDAGVTTSLTGNSSPVAERTEDEEMMHHSRNVPEPRRPLAERLLPKPRKTGVDDMLETPDYPTVSRVMRVQPLPDEKPASGFSWGDYEDVHAGENVGGNEADGEDDGWGVVRRSRLRADRPASTQVSTQKAPETMTKRQRQNANKRDAQKAAKAEAEAERQATLAKHKREIETARMAEQFKGKGSVGKIPSGGMKAMVDERGKLVWE